MWIELKLETEIPMQEIWAIFFDEVDIYGSLSYNCRVVKIGG